MGLQESRIIVSGGRDGVTLRLEIDNVAVGVLHSAAVVGTIYQKVGAAFKTQQHAHEERFCRSPVRTASSFFPVSNDGKDNLTTMNRLPTKLATTTGGLEH
jgi:hypothetical protein